MDKLCGLDRYIYNYLELTGKSVRRWQRTEVRHKKKNLKKQMPYFCSYLGNENSYIFV